jgi:hypothetical protein
MARVTFHMKTSLTRERVLPMPTEFSQCRPELWPTLARERYEVYEVHRACADVRERSPSASGSFPGDTAPIGNTGLS